MPPHFARDQPFDSIADANEQRSLLVDALGASANDAAGESHSTERDRQRRRQAPPGAQNSIESSRTQVGVALRDRRQNLREHQRAIRWTAGFGLDRRRARRELGGYAAGWRLTPNPRTMN